MKTLLINLKWFLLPVTVITFILFLEKATDGNGISNDEEGIMYLNWLLIITNAGLFIFNQKWNDLLDEWF